MYTFRRGDPQQMTSYLHQYGTAKPALSEIPVLSGSPAPLAHHLDDNPMQAVYDWLAYIRKADAVFRNNVIPFLRSIGLRAGVLTLTFRGNLCDKRQADRAFARFVELVLAPHFGPYVRVTERQRRGAWHYHVLVDCLANIRTGFNFDARFGDGPENPNQELRRLRRIVREGVLRCGFGPISTLEPLDIARAQTLYLAKKIGAGGPSRGRRRHRLISYSRDFPRRWWHGFALLTDGAFRWRQYVAYRASQLGCDDLEEIKNLLGRWWAFTFRREIRTDDRSIWNSLPGVPDVFRHLARP